LVGGVVQVTVAEPFPAFAELITGASGAPVAATLKAAYQVLAAEPGTL